MRTFSLLDTRIPKSPNCTKPKKNKPAPRFEPFKRNIRKSQKRDLHHKNAAKMNQIGVYLESILLLLFIVKIKADWGSADSSQYHIQTDEGPERFFRYQTDSGQFRNEKRLKDGTVIGTEAWIDASGYLRQKDYIADKDGYRILKSKTIFVGKSRPIKDVILNGRINTKFLESTTTSSTPVLSVPSIASIPNPNALDNDFGYPKNKPSILVHYNAEPIDGHRLNDKTYIPPVTTYRPAFLSTTTVLPPTSPAAYISSTTTPQPPLADPSPVSAPSKYFLPPYSAAGDSPIIRIQPYTPQSTPIAAYTIEQINELQPPVSSAISLNDVGPGVPFTPTISVSTPSTFDSSTVSPISSTAAGAVPIFNRNNRYRGGKRPIPYYQQNQLDFSNGIDDIKKIDRYNARVSNGFGYFLPRQYHEETYREANANNRDGSFGYIDPFGIRRVVYYHASPDGGLKVRKNNRYVGFNAKPYDSKK